MARRRQGAPAPIVKKGGFLGKFVAFLLGFILGIGAIAGAVAGIVYYAMSSTISATVNLVDGFAPGFYAMVFGADGNNGLLSENYAQATVNDLLGDSMTAVSNIQNNNGSLSELSNIFPVVEDFTAQLLTSLEAYSIPIDQAELMRTPVANLEGYIMECVKKTALGDLVKGLNATDGNSDLIDALSYGEKNVDYKINANGEVVMLNGARKTTINDLLSDDGMQGILNRLPLDAVMKVDFKDDVMCAIAYGSTDRFYENSEGDAVMKQVTYTIEDKGDGPAVYDDKNNLVEAKYEILSTTTAKLTFENGEVQYLKADKDLVCKVYADEKFTTPVLYKKTKIGDLNQDSMALIDNVYLKDALGVDANSHKVLISLAYGEEGVDYKYEGEGANKKIVLIGNAKPRTIGELRSRGGSLINDIPLTDITTEDRDSGLVMYLLYGREGVHYQIDAKTNEVVMLQKHIAILPTAEGTNVYNEYGEKLSDYALNTKDKTFEDADGNQYTYKTGTHAGAIATLETEDGAIAPVYYLENENGPALFTKTTLGDMAGSNNLLSNLTSRITVGEVMDAKSVEGNKFFKHVLDKTIDELPEAINELTLQTVYAEDIYLTDDNGNFLDKDGNITTNKDEYVVEHEWWYLLHHQETCDAEHGASCNKDCIEDYKITEMGTLINNMRTNIEMATLNQLKADGMIDGLDDATLKSPVRTSISGVEVDMGDLPTDDGITLGDYTVVQMLNYVNSIFKAVDKLENGA